MVSAIFTPTNIFCDFLSLALHGVADLLVKIFQPTGSLVRSNFKPDSLAPATRRGSGSVQQILLQLCGQDFGEKHLGSAGPWDGLGWPGMAWDVEISCIFLHGLNYLSLHYRSMNKCTVYILFEHGYPLSKDPNDALDMWNSSC